mgnify:FL=1
MDAFARGLAWFMRALIILISVYYILLGDIIASFLYVIAFIVSLFPLIVNAMYNVRLHWIFELSFSFALLWHMLGFFGFYEALPLWDDAGHIFGGAILGLVGFAWLYSMNTSKRISLTTPLIGFISVMWATTAGVIWEIFEFTWDSARGLVNVYGMSQNGLIDTMSDLSWDLVAAICMVLLCIYLVNHTKEVTQNKVLNPFVQIIGHKKR